MHKKNVIVLQLFILISCGAFSQTLPPTDDPPLPPFTQEPPTDDPEVSISNWITIIMVIAIVSMFFYFKKSFRGNNFG